jgi:hypothetical protein
MKTSRKKEPTAEDSVSVRQMQEMAWNSEVDLPAGRGGGTHAHCQKLPQCWRAGTSWCGRTLDARALHSNRAADFSLATVCQAHQAQVRKRKSQKTRKRQELSKPTAQ